MPRKTSKSARTVKVKAHGRSPRGPNGGKPRVTVPAYGRTKPKKKR